MLEKLKNSLVDDWKQFYKWWSMRVAAVLMLAPEIYNQMPMLQSYVNQTWWNRIMIGLAVLVIVGRLKKQDSPAAPKDLAP